jgi:predicted RNA-binding Zn ribbon-like protein
MVTENKARFQLIAGHPALDFINTWDNRFVEGAGKELLTSYRDLLAFIEQSDLLDGRRLARLRLGRDSPNAIAALNCARELREALADIFYAMSQPRLPAVTAAIATLQRYILDADSARRLVLPGGPSRAAELRKAEWIWHDGANELLPVWVLAKSAEDLLTSDAMTAVHACASATCRWLFLDTSKNHSRRWCDMKLCGNRMKARRFADRHLA